MSFINKLFASNFSTSCTFGINPFTIYIKETFKEGGIKASEFVKQASASWKKMSDSEKEPYISKAKSYNEKKKVELLNISKEEKEKLVNEKYLRSISKLNREIRKFNDETNKPKHPMTSYILFFQDKMEKDGKPKGKEEVIKFAKNVGEMWKTISDDEKKVKINEYNNLKLNFNFLLIVIWVAIYLNKAEELKNNYLKELDVWKNVNAEKIDMWNEKKSHLKASKLIEIKGKKGKKNTISI
ncbi:hypothetical protein Mgra_00000794 [Meloidogyne graminicola]|uniref:HMG box domain-containing protein n=1 Tax=Meloidogyne graminicola TaxID=189291 RepID=A0A8T0A1C6_9BILA|nr:hypothetical protein Mgra_00000794 [Meloidogyne graminicola]